MRLEKLIDSNGPVTTLDVSRIFAKVFKAAETKIEYYRAFSEDGALEEAVKQINRLVQMRKKDLDLAKEIKTVGLIFVLLVVYLIRRRR